MFRAERYDKNTYRIVCESGRVAALAQRLSNGKWQVNDCNDRRIVGIGAQVTARSAAVAYSDYVANAIRLCK